MPPIYLSMHCPLIHCPKMMAAHLCWEVRWFTSSSCLRPCCSSPLCRTIFRPSPFTEPTLGDQLHYATYSSVCCNTVMVNPLRQPPSDLAHLRSTVTVNKQTHHALVLLPVNSTGQVLLHYPNHRAEDLELYLPDQFGHLPSSEETKTLNGPPQAPRHPMMMGTTVTLHPGC